MGKFTNCSYCGTRIFTPLIGDHISFSCSAAYQNKNKKRTREVGNTESADQNISESNTVHLEDDTTEHNTRQFVADNEESQTDTFNDWDPNDLSTTINQENPNYNISEQSVLLTFQDDNRKRNNIYSSSELCGLSLWRLLQTSNAPLGLYDKIVRFIKEHQDEDLKEIPRYTSLLKVMRSREGNYYHYPRETSVKVPDSNDTVKVTTFI